MADVRVADRRLFVTEGKRGGAPIPATAWSSNCSPAPACVPVNNDR